MEYQRDWTRIGEAGYVNSEGRRRKVEGALNRLDWENGGTQVLSDQTWLDESRAIAKDLKIAKRVARITLSDDLAPHRLYGFEVQELNGVVRYYVLRRADTGSMFVLAADFYPGGFLAPDD